MTTQEFQQYVRRSMTRCVRACVLLWIVVCQFPMPVAHSHDAMLGATLDVHLWQYHCSNDDCADDTDQLHWHLLMPWDALDEDGQQRLPLTPNLTCSPLASWITESVQSDLSFYDNALPQHDGLLGRIWVSAEPLDLADRCIRQRHPDSFENAYRCVPLCTLLCVARC